MRQRLATWLTALCLFLLPWQTRWIFSSLTLNGEAWEYGQLSVYAVEVLVLVAIFFRGKLQLPDFFRPLLPRLLIFLAAIFLSVVLSAFAALSALSFHPFFAFLLFLLLLDQRLPTKWIAASFVLSLIGPIALGWFQTLTGASPASTLFGLAEHLAQTPGSAVVETAGNRVLRAYGSFSHPNAFGGFLAVGLLFSFALGWMPMIVLLASTIVITFSRSAWLAGVATIPFRLFNPFRPFHLLIILFFLAATIVAFSKPIFTRFDSSERLETKSLDERRSQYTTFDEVWLQNPITGIGYGAYTAALERAFPGSPAWSYQPIHNSFLLMLAEIGILGFAAFCFLLSPILRLLWRSRRSVHGAFACSFALALLILALFDHYLWSSWSGLALVSISCAFMLRSSFVDTPCQ